MTFQALTPSGDRYVSEYIDFLGILMIFRLTLMFVLNQIELAGLWSRRTLSTDSIESHRSVIFRVGCSKVDMEWLDKLI